MQYAAIVVSFSEKVVENFGVHGDDIPAVMEVYKQCFPNKSSHFTLGMKDQVEMGTRVSNGVFLQDHHQAKGKYFSDHGIYYEDNSIQIQKSITQIDMARHNMRMGIGRIITGIKGGIKTSGGSY